MRTITVIGTTLSTPREYVTEATTWGQLKDAIQRDFGDVSKMRVTSKATRNDLERDDAVLFDGDDTLFITQKSIKAGGVDIIQLLEALREEYNEAIDNVVNMVESGAFDTEEPINTVQYGSKAQSRPQISAEDAAMLRELQNS